MQPPTAGTRAKLGHLFRLHFWATINASTKLPNAVSSLGLYLWCNTSNSWSGLSGKFDSWTYDQCCVICDDSILWTSTLQFKGLSNIQTNSIKPTDAVSSLGIHDKLTCLSLIKIYKVDCCNMVNRRFSTTKLKCAFQTNVVHIKNSFNR